MEDFKTKIVSSKAFLFDFDGTIANLDELHVVAFNKVFEHLGLQFGRDDFMKYMSGKPSDEGLISYFAEHEIYNVDIKFYKKYFNEIKRDALENHMTEYVSLIPGVKDFWNYLTAQKIPYGIVTSSSRDKVLKVLDEFELTGYEFLFDQSDSLKRKPNPDPFLLGIKEISKGRDLSPTQIVAFEDSRFGLMSSKAAGLYTVGILNKGWNDDFVSDLADYVIEDYSVITNLRSSL